MASAQVFVNVHQLVTVPITPVVFVTVILPVVAADGTVAVIFVALFTTRLAVVPLNFTTELELNPTPLITTLVPVGPVCGATAEIPNVIVNDALLVAVPPGPVT
jgi:hypothetical protein